MTLQFSKRVWFGMVISCVLMTGCIQSDTTVLEERVRPVRTVIVQQGSGYLQATYVGSSQASVTSELSFRISGVVETLSVDVGQALSRGDLIAKLNDAELLIALSADKAVLAQATAESENATAQYQKFNKLYERALVSRVDFENSRTAHQTGLAKVQQAINSVQLREQQLEYATLYAPLDGCEISDIAAEVNENVSPGQAIATLSCSAEIEVLASVPEVSAKEIKSGDAVSISFTSLPGQSFNGIVVSLGLYAGSAGAYPVVVQVADQAGGQVADSSASLRPGMSAEVTFNIPLSENTNNIWVPMHALSEDESGRFVYIFSQTDSDTSSATDDASTTAANRGKVSRREVTTGLITSEGVEIVSGLSNGEQVITAGISNMREGMVVSLLNDQD